MSKLLTADEILEAQDLAMERVSVPEWGGDVMVRMMSAADRDAFEASMIKVGPDGVRLPDLSLMRAKLVAATVVDADGNRLFTFDQVEMLGRKSAKAMQRVTAVAERLNALGQTALEDAEKNSAAGQTGDSSSA